MAAYTFSCFSIFTRNYEDEEKRVLIRQDVLMFLLQFAAFGTMYLATKDIRILFLYAVLTVILLAVILLYNLIYPNVSRLVVNNMCMLITVGMIMITRLSADNPSPYGTAVRQLVFVALGITFGLVVPVLIRKMKFLDQWTYIYAAVGGAALLAVALFAQISGGAKLGFEIAGINIQPSEFVKIISQFHCNIQKHHITAYTDQNQTKCVNHSHFFCNSRKDKICLRNRYRIRLSFKKSCPKPASRTDRKQRLCHLITASAVRPDGILPRLYPDLNMRKQMITDNCRGCSGSKSRYRIQPLSCRDKKHNKINNKEDQCRSQIRREN